MLEIEIFIVLQKIFITYIEILIVTINSLVSCNYLFK